MTDTHDVKTMADGAAIAIGVTNYMQWLPPIISLISSVVVLAYMSVRLWETDTVKKLTGRNDA